MRGLGLLLILCAAGMALWGLSFDASVATDLSPNALLPALPERVINMDLATWRLVIFIAAAALFAGGCAIWAAGELLAELKKVQPDKPALPAATEAATF